MCICVCVCVCTYLFSCAVGGICRVPAFGNIELRQGDFESRLVNGQDRCEVYTCVVSVLILVETCSTDS